MTTKIYDYILALSDFLKEKDVQSTNQSRQDLMNCLKDLIPLWLEFKENLRVTSIYCIMYLEIVQIVLRYVRSEGIGARLEHIEEIQNMLPFSCKHSKDLACLALYLKEMRDLPQTHPEVYNEFINGNHTIRHKQNKANGVWNDLALEQIYNKEDENNFSQRINTNSVARDKYIKTDPFLTNVSGCVKDMASMGPQMSCHHGKSKAGQSTFGFGRNYEREDL